MILTYSKGQNPTEVHHVVCALVGKEHSSGATRHPALTMDLFLCTICTYIFSTNALALSMLQHLACPYNCHVHTGPRNARYSHYLAAPMLTDIMAAVQILSRLAATRDRGYRIDF